MLDNNVIDISIAYAADVPVWPGDVPFSCGWTARREDGSSVNLAHIACSTHAGTHADAPLHVESSWGASETLPIAPFVGEALVVSTSFVANGAPRITLRALQHEVERVSGARAHPIRLLLCTGHSVARGTFPEVWPVLDDDAAAWLVANGTRLVGTDAPSVDARDSKTLPVHHALFSGGAFVIENLSLAHVAPGTYELLAQPVRMHGADAAPVRALLRPLP